jgi:hypothetical protein
MTTGTRFLFNFHRCRGPVTLEEKLSSSTMLELFAKVGLPASSFNVQKGDDGSVSMGLVFTRAHISAGFFTHAKGRHVVGHVYLVNEGRKNGARGRKAVQALKRYFRPEHADVEELPWEFS